MSKSNAKKLAEKLAKDKKFRDEFLAEKTKVALEFAKKAGLECTAEELKEIAGGNNTRNELDGLIISHEGSWILGQDIANKK